MLSLGQELSKTLAPGSVLLLSGPLGVGKTTLVRGVLRALGWKEPVRSPTFNLLQTYETNPPVAHLDLYRVQSAAGIGLEDLLDSHATLIEWPENLGGLIDPAHCTTIDMEFDGETRVLDIRAPTA